MTSMDLAYITIGLAVVGIIAIIVCIIKFIIFIIKLIIKSYSPRIRAPKIDNSFEGNHQRMKQKLEKAEAYRRSHFKTWD